MKLKCLTSCASNGKSYNKGETYDLSASEAKALDYNFEQKAEKKEKSEDKPKTKKAKK